MLYNRWPIHKISPFLNLSEITRLNEELAVEKEKRLEIERKLQSLTDKLFQLENCNLNTKLANNTTNNENLASSELTNFKACIVIPDNTSEGSHTITENANDINIQSGNVDFRVIRHTLLCYLKMDSLIEIKPQL